MGSGYNGRKLGGRVFGLFFKSKYYTPQKKHQCIQNRCVKGLIMLLPYFLARNIPQTA